MTVQAKAIVDAFYGSAPKAVVLERLLAGRPPGRSPKRSAIRPTSTPSSPARRPSTTCALHGARMAINAAACTRTADSYIPPEKYPTIHAAVLAGVRRARRRQGRRHREPDALPVRSESARVQGRGSVRRA